VGLHVLVTGSQLVLGSSQHLEGLAKVPSPQHSIPGGQELLPTGWAQQVLLGGAQPAPQHWVSGPQQLARSPKVQQWVSWGQQPAPQGEPGGGQSAAWAFLAVRPVVPAATAAAIAASAFRLGIGVASVRAI
jgi:hypothetical protein